MNATPRIGAALALLLFLTAGLAAQAPESRLPKPENLDAWFDFIRPSAEELRWQDIGWCSMFWPAVEEARRLGRPILLWTMNGHPLGCT